MKKILLLLGSSVLAAGILASANAATNVWVGDTDNDFLNQNNWTGNVLPNFGTDIMRFDSAGIQGNSTITNVNLTMTNTGTSAGTNLSQILFSGSTPALTLTGGNITLGTAASNIYNNAIVLSSGSTVTQTIGSNIVIGDGGNYTASVVSNSITGGLLKLAGNITGGTGAVTPGAIVFSLGNTNAHNGDYLLTGNLAAGGATSFTLTKRGTGTATLNGTNTINTLNNSNEAGQVVISGGNTTISTGLNFGTNASIGSSVRVTGGILNLTMVDGTSGWGTGTANQTLRISGGTVNTTSGRAIDPSILVDGGNLNINSGASRFSFGNANTTLTISSGNVTVASGVTNGVRFGNTSGNAANQAGGNATTVNQSGGTFTVFGAGASTTTFSIGASDTAAGMNSAYNLSGGVLDVRGTNDANGYILLGANTNGNGSTTLALSGTGKLISRFNPATAGGISGAQTNGVQVLSLTGGTLVAGRIDATNLRGSLTDANGTMINNGTSIAPGDIGTSGRTAIVGGLTLTSGTLLLDIGGTTAATAFQGTSSQFDNISVTGALSLGGNLTLSLINGYTPVGNQTFTILTAASISNTFAGLSDNSTFTSGGQDWRINYGSTSVVLTAVPEPATFALLVAGMAAVVLYRRRRA